MAYQHTHTTTAVAILLGNIQTISYLSLRIQKFGLFSPSTSWQENAAEIKITMEKVRTYEDIKPFFMSSLLKSQFLSKIFCVFLVLLKISICNKGAFHARYSKSSLKHSIRFHGIFFQVWNRILLHIGFLKCQIAFLKFTSCDNQAFVGCIPVAAVAFHLKLKS